MSFIAFILIFISAFCHTGWNFFGKGGANSTLSFTISTFINCIYFIPLIIYLHEYMIVGISFWQLILVAGLFNALAIWSLLVAYKYGDYTFVYPLKNGLPPLLSAILGFIIGSIGIKTNLAYLGFFLILLGCLLLPFKSIKDFSIKNYINKASIYCVLSAIGTSVYSTVDGNVTKAIKEQLPNLAPYKASLIYAPLMYFATFIFMIFFLYLDKILFKINLKDEKLNFKLLCLVSFFMVFGYSLVLTAYQFVSNVSYVVAFRQLGMPISFLLGIFILKEKPYIGKIIGTLIIISGLVITAIF